MNYPESKSQKLVGWLKPLEYNVKHEISSRQRQKDTGTWLFDDRLYRQWEEADEDGSQLWLHGIPGSGKTILA